MLIFNIGFPVFMYLVGFGVFYYKCKHLHLMLPSLEFIVLSFILGFMFVWCMLVMNIILV